MSLNKDYSGDSREADLSTENMSEEADLQGLVVQKARELFTLCDTEGKGYITKQEMLKLKTELPLSQEQLEAVFDSLDDGDGYLTMEEFMDGFGGFLELKMRNNSSNLYEADEADTQEADDARNFQEMMENIQASQLFDDVSAVKSLWCRLRRNEPEMQSQFEDFLYKISNDLKRTQENFQSLEGVLKSKTTSHDEEVRKLYEEMEFQIKQEKEKILAEEKAKERQIKEELEQELLEKDRQLQEIIQGHQEMEHRLTELNVADSETKQENERLLKEKESLEEMLMRSEEGLEESKSYINQLRQQHLDEKRERARSALKVTENIALERESIVKQLDNLREMNKKLRDDKEEAEIRRDISVESSISQELSEAMETSPDHTRENSHAKLVKQGSLMSKYFPTSSPRSSTKVSISGRSVSSDITDLEGIEDDGIECDDDIFLNESNNSFNEMYGNPNFEYIEDLDQSNDFLHDNCGNVANENNSSYSVISDSACNIDNDRPVETLTATLSKHSSVPSVIEDISSSENEFMSPHRGRGRKFRPLKRPKQDQDVNVVGVAGSSKHARRAAESDLSSEPYPDSPRQQPVGADDRLSEKQVPSPGPERVFKVVFVGDSGVGKSSFIHRFCNDRFIPTFSATIGVDFQVKSLDVDGHGVFLQLWDTAGQERFRSITKQYFRKADGVLVMYDVTSESTFTNVRNWMISVKEGVEEGTVIVLVGNKTDLSEEEDHRVVKVKDGATLASEYEAIFYETSAKSGYNVKESVEGLARLLRDREDKEMEKAMRLEDVVEKKKGCCS